MKRVFLLARDRRDQPLAAFTVLELLVTITVIGVLTGAFLFAVNTGNWRRQRVNAVAQELAGWMEEVMAFSTRENSQCVIQINAGTFAPGAVVAQVTNAGVCPVREPTFRLPALVNPAGQTFQIGLFPANANITYTPRGTVTNQANTQVVVALQPEGPVRCVRVSATLGLISIGRNDVATTAAAACPDANFDLI